MSEGEQTSPIEIGAQREDLKRFMDRWSERVSVGLLTATSVGAAAWAFDAASHGNVASAIFYGVGSASAIINKRLMSKDK